MSIFDQAYDEMSIQEVCFRLPGDLAIRALKRRITDLPTLLDFIKTVGSQPTFVPELKNHINDLITNEKVPDILASFDHSIHPSLFGWLSDGNKERIKNEGRTSLDAKFLFNLAGDKDLEDLNFVLEALLKDTIVKQSSILSVLNKADSTIFPQLMDLVVRDSRPEVRECILAINSVQNNNLVSEHQRTVALKAFTKSTAHLPYLNAQNLKSFTALKPKERLDTLTKYFGYFPSYRKINVFDPAPTQEEFDMILFAGCIEFNDLVSRLSNRYKEITELDPPVIDTADETEDDDI